MSGHSTDERAEAVILDTRRRRTLAEKEALVAELKVSGATVSAVARRHNVAASLLFRWRKELSGAGGQTPASLTGFVPVVLGSSGPAREGKTALASGSGIIEIELAGGRRVRVDGSVDVAALRRVIDILDLR